MSEPTDAINFAVGWSYYECLDCGFVYSGQGPAPRCSCPPQEPTMRVSAVDHDTGTVTLEAL